MVQTGLSELHQRQLKARGIDAALAARLGWTSVSRLSGSISIPFFCDGEVVNHKYRTLGTDKKFAQDENAKKCLWNCDVLKDESLADQPVIITEGELDAISAIQAGFTRTVSVPDGAPQQPLGGADGPKYSYLDDVMPLLRKANEIIIASDNDGPGTNLLHDLSIRLGRAACKFLLYPIRRTAKVRCKDLNEVLMEYGVKGIVQTINNAKWIALPGLYRMSELPPLPEQPIMELGMDAEMDRHIKARRGDFWVITGSPGHGKTALVTDILCHLTDKHHLKIAWGSFENRPQQDLRRQLRQWHIGKQRIENAEGTPDFDARWQANEIAEADAWIEERFVFMVPTEDENLTIQWALERGKAAALRYDCDIMVIDPWNEMDHSRPQDMMLTEYVGEAIKSMKRMAAMLQMMWVVVAHPTKLRTGEIVGLGTISDSAHWSNKADIGLVISRPDDDGSTSLRIAKVRFEQIGRRGEVNLRFNSSSRRFYSPASIG